MNVWLVFILSWAANVGSGAAVYALARRHGAMVTSGFLGRHIFTPNTVAQIEEQYRGMAPTASLSRGCCRCGVAS